MRILHTSDWHLGRSFHGVGLLDAQAVFLDHVVETVRAESVDLVVVSGDIYDRALPPVGAVDLLSDVLARLAALGVRVVVSSGNHDSAVRLGANSRLADHAGVHLRTRPEDVGMPVIVEDRWGPVAVYGLPYLEPDAVRGPWGLTARSHEATLAAAMERVHADLRQRPGARSVVMAHAFVAGSADAAHSMASDSERDISVGGLAIAPTSLFTSVDYAALGHLHAPRALTETVRYSGSPVAYSFSEADQTKGSWLVELGREGFERADLVEAPVVRRLQTVRGRLEDLLRDPTLQTAEASWVQAVITDRLHPRAALERLRQRFPHTVLLEFQPEGPRVDVRRTPPRVDAASDVDIALGFVREVRDVEPSTEEELLLRLACDSCRINSDPDRDRTIEVAS